MIRSATVAGLLITCLSSETIVLSFALSSAASLDTATFLGDSLTIVAHALLMTFFRIPLSQSRIFTRTGACIVEAFHSSAKTHLVVKACVYRIWKKYASWNVVVTETQEIACRPLFARASAAELRRPRLLEKGSRAHADA